MNAPINNITDLRLEIARLQQVKTGQETAIKQHFNSPRAILGTITAVFTRHKSPEDAFSALSKYDISGLISRFVLPFTLNKTLFRKSNFIVKALVGLVSQKASGLVTDKRIGGVWDKLKAMIPDSLMDKLPFTTKKPTRRLLLPQKSR